MIKTVRKLICDHCGREIAEDGQYITESTCLTLYRWDGNLGILDEDQPSEHSTKDLCMLCYLKLHGETDGRTEQQASAEDQKAEVETLPNVAEEHQTAELPYIPPQTVAEPAVLEIQIPPEEPQPAAEDVAACAMCEAMEMEGKTYTEYHRPDPIIPDPIIPDPIIPGPIIPDPVIPAPETPEPPLEAREAAARILAIAEKKPRKRLTREQKEQITKRMKQGKSCAKVGEELGREGE